MMTVTFFHPIGVEHRRSRGPGATLTVLEAATGGALAPETEDTVEVARGMLGTNNMYGINLQRICYTLQQVQIMFSALEPGWMYSAICCCS